MREPVVSCTVSGPSQLAELVALARSDLAQAGTVADLRIVSVPGATGLGVDVELGPAAQPAP
jgi:hypothetical protein